MNGNKHRNMLAKQSSVKTTFISSRKQPTNIFDKTTFISVAFPIFRRTADSPLTCKSAITMHHSDSDSKKLVQQSKRTYHTAAGMKKLFFGFTSFLVSRCTARKTEQIQSTYRFFRIKSFDASTTLTQCGVCSFPFLSLCM